MAKSPASPSKNRQSADSTRVNVTLTATEYARLQTAARALGKPPTTVARLLLVYGMRAWEVRHNSG